MRLIKAFYDFRAYATFIREKNRAAKMAMHAVLVAAIAFAVTVIYPARDFASDIFNIDRKFIDENVPEFYISGGNFYISEPVLYEDPAGLALIIAVSDENITADDAWHLMSFYSQAFIISSRTVVIKQAGGSVSEFSVSRLPEITRADVYAVVPFLRISVILAFLLLFFLYTAAFFAGSFVCAGIAVFISRRFGPALPFMTLFTLTVYARTAPVIFRTLIIFAAGGTAGSVWFSFFVNWLLFYAMFCIYIWQALAAVRESFKTKNIDTSGGLQ
ncbi:MAG: DUF1189 domain-containing protein [Defluviitaleaceae bacterium]|nr:DUF1189 domain-containing protein [Defluviitaleaceae bacterium]